jgi:divinyl protochlorophyllide a 8-vinyl-reductase
MTPRAAATSGAGVARVGPNAILQYLPVLEDSLGTAGLHGFLKAGQFEAIPDGSTMIEEEQAARFHQAVRRSFPDQARELARRAGAGTAEYIIANRIPAFARAILAILPTPVAENMLCRSIAEHAWTFAGSGIFNVDSQPPITFEIVANPIVRDERSNDPVCEWHAAVFERLFSRLVGGVYDVMEKDCCACGVEACRFEVQRLS